MWAASSRGPPARELCLAPRRRARAASWGAPSGGRAQTDGASFTAASKERLSFPGVAADVRLGCVEGIPPRSEGRLSGRTFGKFEVLGSLGRGGMAEVHLCRLPGIGGFSKQVVVKRILPERLSDPAFLRMFLDEARLAANLNHP